MKYLIILLVVLFSGCASIANYSYDIPEQIVEWSKTNVWKILVDRGTASAFWINETMLITNCHVVEGRGNIIAQDSSLHWNIDLTVKACDSLVDLALLEYKGDSIDFVPLKTIIAKTLPRPGKAIYGPGYPLGNPLLIVTGHWQFVEDDGYTVTAAFVEGDSGSPALILEGGRVIVVGVRTEFMVLRKWFGPVFFPHLATVRDSEKILKFLRENA